MFPARIHEKYRELQQSNATAVAECLALKEEAEAMRRQIADLTAEKQTLESRLAKILEACK